MWPELACLPILIRKSEATAIFATACSIYSACASEKTINYTRTIDCTSISFHKKFGLRLAHSNCDCREFYPRTVIYTFTISQFTFTAQSEQEVYMWTEHAWNGPSTCEQDLQLTSASPHVNRTIAQGHAIKHEIHISISTYHTIPHQTLSYTMPCLPGHTIYHAIHLQAIPYTMPCHARQAISYTMAYLTRSCHMPCHAQQAISYTKPNITRPYHIPCLQGHTIYRVIPRQAIRYTLSCSTGHSMPYPTRQ